MDNPARITRHDFVVSPADRAAGLHVHGVGSRIAPPHTSYQIHEEGAPYQWKNGRTISEYALVCLTEGEGVFQSSRNRTVRVRAGDMLVLRPGVWHNYYPDRKIGWREYWVTFNGPAADKLLATLGHPKRTTVLRLGVDGALCRIFMELLEIGREKPPYLNLALTGKLFQLLATVFGRARLQKEGGQQEHSLIAEARNYMESHLAETMDMKDVARSLHVSYRHFRRIFKEATGMPPHHYLLNLRLIRARRLLEEKDIKISTLARMVGFDDPYYFSRIFKRKTGIAPVHWRG